MAKSRSGLAGSEDGSGDVPWLARAGRRNRHDDIGEIQPSSPGSSEHDAGRLKYGRARRRHKEVDPARVWRAWSNDECAVGTAGAPRRDRRQGDHTERRLEIAPLLLSAARVANARTGPPAPRRACLVELRERWSGRCVQGRIRSGPTGGRSSPAPAAFRWVMNHQIASSTTMTIRMIAHIGNPLEVGAGGSGPSLRSLGRSSRRIQRSSRRSWRRNWLPNLRRSRRWKPSTLRFGSRRRCRARPPRPARSPDAPSIFESSGGSAAEIALF